MTVYKRLRTALLALAALAFVSSAAFADSAVSLFVGKSEVKGVVHGGKVYVPADQMLKAMGYTWTASGDGYTLQPGTAGGPAIGAGPHFRLGSREAAPQTMIVKGKTWIEAGAMTQGLGGFYLYSPGVGIAQATFSGAKPSQADVTKAVKEARKEAKAEDEAEAKRRATAWKSSSGNGSSSGGSSSDESSSDDDKTKSAKGAAPTDDEPIAIDRVTFSTAVTGVMKGHVVLKNDAEVAIRNVFVYITMQAPDEPGKGPTQISTGAGGGASLPAYVRNTTDGSLPTYGGTPPPTISSGYPEQASGSGGPPSSGPAPQPAATPSTTASPSPEAKPTPTPMHVVATLPAIFVAVIEPGQTLSVPFEWHNDKGLQQVQPSVLTQHEKVDFTRKKAKTDEDEDADKDKKDESGDKKDETKSGDESGDKKSDEKKSEDGKSDSKTSDDKKTDDKKPDDKKADDKKADSK